MVNIISVSTVHVTVAQNNVQLIKYLIVTRYNGMGNMFNNT